MYRGFLSRYRLVYCAHIPGLTNVFDNPDETVKLEPRNGVERVFALFQKDQRGELSKEVISSIQIMLGSGFALATYGGFKYSKGAFENWITLHSTTLFRTGYEAKRALLDHIAVEFGKYFIIYGFKGIMFSGVLMFTLITVSAFRDKSGILEYFVAGLLAGSTARITSGLRAMFSGAVIGAALCTMTGLFANLLMKIGNITIEDVRKWQQDIQITRKNLIKEAESNAVEDEISQSFKHYTSRLTQPKNDDDDDDDDKVFVLVNEEKNVSVK